MTDLEKTLEALLRSDLPSFIHKSFLTLEPGRPYLDNWHIRHLCWQLDRVARGEIKRLIINIPPRYAKSMATSICWPAFLLGHDPSRRIMCVSHTTGLARAHAIQFSNLVQAEWFAQLFPRFQSLRARNRDVEFMTSLHGYRTAFAMTGGILGRGADIIIIDDPMRGEAAYSAAERRRAKEVFDGTISTRLNNKEQGAIVLVMQRLHQEDLVSHVMAQEDWEVVSIPAIAIEARTYQLGRLATDVYERPEGALLQEEREGSQTMEVMRRRLGTQGFAAQYQQEPVPQDGTIIGRDWLRYYETPPVDFDIRVASWDTASTLGEQSDYSVGTVWGLRSGQFYLLDLVRGRFEVPELRRRIIELHRHHDVATTIIEKTELGRALLHEIRASTDLVPILQQPLYDKQARMLAQAPKFEAGQVLLPRDTPWLAQYLAELMGFPYHTHDDQIDSTSQALRYLSRVHSSITQQRPVGTRRPRSRLRHTG